VPLSARFGESNNRGKNVSIKPYEMRQERRLRALAQRQKPDGLDNYFVEIAQQFRPYMHSIALSILGNQDTAEDAVSDALLKAYVNLHGFTPDERENLKARAWLAEIVRNVCIDRRNKQKEEESLEALMHDGFQVIAPPIRDLKIGC
jgi:DNA-directed RNA polymerase specialized sigma24 family protein